MNDRAEEPLLKSSISNKSNSSIHSSPKPPLNESYNSYNYPAGQVPNQPSEN